MLVDICKLLEARASGDADALRDAWDTETDPVSVTRCIVKGRMRRDEGKYEEAKEWFRKGAEAGSGEAAFLLGEMLYLESGDIRDDRECYTWLETAYRAGFKEAARLLGDICYGVCEPELADHWYFAYSSRPDPETLCKIARAYVQELKNLRRYSCPDEDDCACEDAVRGDEEERWATRAYELFRAASGACPETELGMGEILSMKGPAERDRAIAHFLRAAARGLTEGYKEAAKLKDEDGDLRGAQRLYFKAAKDGWPDAMTDLARTFAEGGGERNQRAATTWYLRAAALWDYEALFEAGRRLLEGST